ncbi:radical SAM protein [candidate division KSB1 bacterium]|nr:radical SAM protein [candidate division KSB1 bacterium]
MNSIEPFIIEFKTKKGNQYVYDVTTNCIYPSSEITIEILKNFKNMNKTELFKLLIKKYPESKIKSTYSKIVNWVKFDQAFFPVNELKIRPMLPETEFYKKLANCSHIILVPTNQCNLRCKYCAFSGEYEINRVHNDETMNFRIAKKSIDYFISLLKSNKRTSVKKRGAIGFYGGEPLIKFSLIKQCMEYVKTIGCEDIIFWNITTNGTLLTKEKVKYFMKFENIKIGISLDGPESEHDRHRVFRNGGGTFKSIMKNLKMINSLNPEFYKKHIHFQPLLPRLNNPYHLLEFLSSELLVSQNAISAQIGDITLGAKTFYNKLTEDKKELFYYRYDRLFKKHIDMLIKGDVESREMQILLALTSNVLAQMNMRPFRLLKSLYFSTGTCIPGTRKIYVAPSGTFHICERVTENHPIGDCFNGIDYKKCNWIYEEYIKNVTKNCHGCPYIHFCSLCFSTADDGQSFNTGEYCNERKTLKAKLSDYYSILEENPDAFEMIGSSDNNKMD